jgi:hypothetical protein
MTKREKKYKSRNKIAKASRKLNQKKGVHGKKS